MTATSSEATSSEQAPVTPATAPAPKRITNAQTVCNEKNAKGKLCNGHLKQLGTAGEAAEVHLRGDDVLSKCQTCGTYYMGPPLGHVRDPNKQVRFVEAELCCRLRAVRYRLSRKMREVCLSWRRRAMRLPPSVLPRRRQQRKLPWQRPPPPRQQRSPRHPHQKLRLHPRPGLNLIAS